MIRPSEARVFLWIVCLGFFPQLGFADTLTGEVRGTVVDVEGRIPLAGVSMTLISVDRGWKKQVHADPNGNYVFIQLEPGHYSLSAEQTGYYRAERTDVLIRLNQPKVVVPPFELRKLVATPTQQITLRGEQTKTAIIDLTAPGPMPVVLAITNEPGLTSMVSLTDWTLRSNYATTLVHNLPLRGTRSFDELALFSPGVFRVPFSSGQGPAVGIGVGTTGQFAVNGLRGRSNNFTVDGSDNNDEDIGVRRQGFVSLVPQSIESVQEIQIMTAGFPAEFGRNSGSMVNAVSRSGQKQLHGSLYGFFNHDRLNAQNFFDRTFEDTVNFDDALNGGGFSSDGFNRQHYGGVLGGKLVTERLFYFLSAERQRYHGTSLAHFVVPTNEERGLRIRNGFVPIFELEPFFKTRDIPYSSNAGQGVFSLYPLPNNPAGPFGMHTYSQAKREEGNGSIFSLKLDSYLSSIHSFAGRYNFTDDDSIIPFTSDAINSSLATDTRTHNISLFLNSTTPGYGNALRFSYGRTRLAFPPERSSPFLFGSRPLLGSPPPGFLPGASTSVSLIGTPYGSFGPFGATGPIGQLSILPYSTTGVDVFNFPQGRADNTFQISDFVAWTGTTHTVKIGFDIRRSQLNSFSDRNSRPLLLFANGIVSSTCLQNPFCLFATEDGLLRGTDLAALGAPGGFLQTISTGEAADTTIGLRFTQYDFFIQDSWKTSPTLTWNFGLRYELQTVPVEANKRIERSFNLSPTQFGRLEPVGSIRDQQIISAGNRSFDSALQALQGFIAGRKRIYASDANNFAPRVGIAWDPWGSGKTAVRGGYSLSYDANLGALTSHSRNVFPAFVPVNLDPNFRPPQGIIVNNPSFFIFVPTGAPLIRPGTLNTYNLQGDAFATGLGTLFIQSFASPTGSFSSNGLAFTLPEKNLETAHAQHFLLSMERQLGHDYLVSTSYVRTLGLHLSRFATPNAGLVSTPVLFSPPGGAPLSIFDLAPTIPPSVNRRPQAALGAYTVFENSASSSYHSLQLGLENRLSGDLQFRADWTWSHTLDEVSDPFDGRGFFSLPQDSTRLDLERASANFDVRHRLTGFLLWDLSRLLSSAVLRGWRLAMVGEFQSGQPFSVNTSLDRNFDGNLTDRLDSTKGLRFQPGKAHLIHLDPAIPLLSYVAPRSRNGRVARNSFRADGLATVDVAISRSFSVAETSKLDFRLEIFNILNETAFGIPIRILESPGFGRSFDTQVNARTLRLALKLSF